MLKDLVRYAVVIVATIVAGCPEPVENPCQGKVSIEVSRLSVHLVPGTSTYVVLNGIPPFYITTPPDPTIATATFLDSSRSPATLVFSASTTATIGEDAFVIVGDECVDGVSISIEITTGTVSYSDHIQAIWHINCQSRGCHPGGDAPFSLDPSVSWSNLWFAGVTNMSCGAIYRLVGGLNGGPGNPDSSLLYMLVSGQTTCPRMPFSADVGDTLSQVNQDLIKAWIESGAENN